MDTGCYFYFFLVKLVKYFILFCLVDFCTTIIGEINMINNVDEHPISIVHLYSALRETPLIPNISHVSTIHWK